MNAFVKAELERLNEDFKDNTGGTRFAHFFCPILFRDEKTELCEAHIINKAFADSTRESTVQRRDVDNFYGSRFESDFLDSAAFKLSHLEILADRSLAKRFNATLLREGKPVEHFYPRGEVPEKFSLLQLGDLPSKPLGLKMDTADLVAAADENWEIEVSRDIRLPMLVSTIKAAHLSLFKMLGYQYALRSAGRFVGHDILGKFFLENQKRRKRDLPERAVEFFRPFVHMVRPVISTTIGAQGTVTDRLMFLCMGGSGMPWAFIVLIKTSEQMHGVMIPSFGDPDQIATFLDFLHNPNSSIHVATCRFAGDKWEISKGTMPMTWPKDGILLP
jgi:hypothetical protein